MKCFALGAAPRGRWRQVLAGCAVGLCFAFASSGKAADGTHIFQIEEEWEMVVGNADGGYVAPQVTCAMSPVGHLEGIHATFEINHSTAPSFSAGGLTVHLWNGETRLASASHSLRNVLANNGEVVRWKTQMTLIGGVLFFDIDDGSSSTWGNFGSGMRISTPVDLEDLDAYSACSSCHDSGVGFASNRVQSLKIKSVKATYSNGQSAVDNTVHTVHEL